MYDTTKMTVEEIRGELVKLGMKQDAVDSIKGKGPLSELLLAYNTEEEKETMDDDELDVEFNDEEVQLSILPIDEADVPPLITDPAWSDYVLTKLTESEMFEGAPKVSGLRRVVELLLGTIVQSKSKVYQCPNTDNERRATVRHRIVIKDDDGMCIIADGVADVYSGNADRIYANHPAALAETRAEGRALRRLLKLSSNVITAEEKIKPTEAFEGFSFKDDNKINDVQIKGIDLLGKRTDVNIAKLLDKNELGANIKELSSADGITLLNSLSSYQSTGVPDELKGYDGNWRTKLESK